MHGSYAASDTLTMPEPVLHGVWFSRGAENTWKITNVVKDDNDIILYSCKSVIRFCSYTALVKDHWTKILNILDFCKLSNLTREKIKFCHLMLLKILRGFGWKDEFVRERVRDYIVHDFKKDKLTH